MSNKYPTSLRKDMPGNIIEELSQLSYGQLILNCFRDPNSSCMVCVLSLEGDQVDGGIVNFPPVKFTITLKSMEIISYCTQNPMRYWCVFTVRVLQ